MKRRWMARLLAVAAALLALLLFPHLWCGRHEGAWYRGDVALQSALDARMEAAVQGPLSTEQYPTGHERFNGEWLFGTYMMAGMGLGHRAVRLLPGVCGPRAVARPLRRGAAGTG